MSSPEPAFVAKPGQIDYTHIRYAPVLNSVITCGDKILLVQRSHGMRLYPGMWSGISGFLDDNGSIEDKITEELSEELGIELSEVASITRGQVILQEAPDYHKTWLVVPLLVVLNSEAFQLNWEAEAARWFTLDELQSVELLPGYDQVLAQLLPADS